MRQCQIDFLLSLDGKFSKHFYIAKECISAINLIFYDIITFQQIWIGVLLRSYSSRKNYKNYSKYYIFTFTINFIDRCDIIHFILCGYYRSIIILYCKSFSSYDIDNEFYSKSLMMKGFRLLFKNSGQLFWTESRYLL